jgi:putative phosphoesterase
MQIGLISDTHSYLDPKVFEAFKDCDEIWHAGDFGTLKVAEELAEFLPLKGVYGNIDDREIRGTYPENLRFKCEGVDILMTHIAGRPGRYPARVKKLLNESPPPDVLICGHSHIVHVENDWKYKKMKYLNPGAAGHEGHHVMRTLIKLKCEKGKLKDMKLVELGPRGRHLNDQ